MIKVIFASGSDSNMRHAVKTNVTSSFFFIDKGKKKYAFLDKRDFGISRKNRMIAEIPLEPIWEEAKLLKHKTADRNRLALILFKKYGLLRKKVEVPVNFPLDMADFLRKNGAKLVPIFPFYPERAVKSQREINHIKENLKNTRRAFRKIEEILKASKISGNKIFYSGKILTSEFLKQEAEKVLIETGMFDVQGMIISSGKDSAIPHHHGTGPIKPHQPIVCDIFPRHRKSGYFADMTRTYVKGKPSPEIQKMYSAVLKAQTVAMKKIRAGVSAKEIYHIAADMITKNGYHVGEAGLVHGLGHGVGLDIHEKPSLKPDSGDILEAGNVITIEPGLYYPKIGGVRIEDIVLVTKTGHKNLTSYPKRLIIT